MNRAHNKIQDGQKFVGIPGIRILTATFVCFAGFLLQAGTAFAAQSGAGEPQMKLLPLSQMFTFFFLMLGPIKIIGPFAKATQGADVKLARQIAFRAALFAVLALLLAALLGESLIKKYGVPLHVLALAGGIILFLVALQTILQQFTPPARASDEGAAPNLSMAMSPIAFPTIVTPYGVAALIIFVALSPTLQDKLEVGGILLGIMFLNMACMLLARHILRFMGVLLQLLGAVLGIIQVSLGLQIVLSTVRMVWS